MPHRTNKPIPKLRKAPQPPLSHAGAIPDSDRAKRPPLAVLLPCALSTLPIHYRMAYPVFFKSASCPFKSAMASLAWPIRC
jgi:hypothetical protein